jgi:tRNA 5-methylaminomethyl-2-thiouridine biosynthesis bifunctional protein
VAGAVTEIPALRIAGHMRGRLTRLFAGPAALDGALAAWQAWADDGSRSGRLYLIVLLPTLPPPQALRAYRAGTPMAAHAARLADALPPAVPGLHRLAFDDGRVHWLIVPGPLHAGLRALRATVDDIRLGGGLRAGDGDVVGLAKSLARLAAAGATLQLQPVDAALVAALQRVGFRPIDAAASATVWSAVHAPYRPRPAEPVHGDGRGAHALIVGAGLAGCAAAWALAEHGWTSELLERRPAPAGEASSNPGGLFHGTVNAADGPHARFNRAAALEAARAVRLALAQGVAGGADGLLRLHHGDAAVMRATLHRLRLPPEYAAALDAAAASAACGLRLAQPAWLFPGGGWVDPAGFARHLLARAGPAARFRGGLAVARQRRGHAGWELLDAAGRVLAAGPVVVLAGAADALRLLDGPPWPLRQVRGQLSIWPGAATDARIRLPRLPLAGSGYLLPAVGSDAVFGATAQADDPDAEPRAADHAHNLARLQRLSPGSLPSGPPPTSALQGRVGWRCLLRDRLPAIGPAPAAGAGLPAEIPLARLPREPGLHLWCGLASRGITWAALGAQLLAARLAGTPWPVERALADAVDPARFALRRRRRGG